MCLFLLNRSTVLASDLANAICDKILKEDDDDNNDDDNDKIEKMFENCPNEKSQPEEILIIKVTENVTKIATPKKSHNKQVNIVVSNESAADDGTNGKVDVEKEIESVKEEVGAGDVSV